MDIRIGVTAALLGAAWAAGCDGSPDGAATTRPAGVDTSDHDGSGQATGPSAAKLAVIAWARAIDAGDLAAAKGASDGDAEQIKALEALVEQRNSEAKLDAAVRRTFPKQAATTAPDEPQGLAATVERAAEKADGDTVTVWAYLEDNPLLARKQADGQWKVALDHLTSDTETSARMKAKANEALAAEVSAGEYASPEEALDALDAKMAEAAEAMGVDAPAEPPGEAPADALEPE